MELWLASSDKRVGGRLDEFLRAWWPRLRPGGWLIVHSTLTNAVTRHWLEKTRAATDAAAAEAADGAPDAPPRRAAEALPRGEYRELSFLEPHKRYQNSCSVFQKRSGGYAEPILTSYP